VAERGQRIAPRRRLPAGLDARGRAGATKGDHLLGLPRMPSGRQARIRALGANRVKARRARRVGGL